MSLTRVQTTGKVSADSVPSIAVTFATPPTIGNGIVVPVSIYSFATPVACVDNRGNAYTLAKYQSGNTAAVCAIFFCAAITGAAAPFTITVSVPTTAYFSVLAHEVGGVGFGLVLDQTVGAFSAPALAVATGASVPLTAVEELLVAVNAINATQASITVESVSPAWTQDMEELSFSHAAGEADSRIVTGVLGTPASCSWTLATATYWTAVLAAFKAGTAPPVGHRPIPWGAFAMKRSPV